MSIFQGDVTYRLKMFFFSPSAVIHLGMSDHLHLEVSLSWRCSHLHHPHLWLGSGGIHHVIDLSGKSREL